MMAVMGPSEALRRLTRRPGANFGGVIRSGPTLHRRSPSDNNGFAPRVLRNQSAYPTNRAFPSSPAWQFSLPHATLGFRRRPALNGEDSTFSAGFAVPGVGRNPEATGLLKRSGHRDQARLGSNTLRISGRYVYHLRERLM